MLKFTHYYSKIVAYTTLGMLLASCNSVGDYCVIHGNLDGMQNGELYIFTPQGPREKIDTLTLREGKFTYQLPNPEEGYGYLMFPNHSQLVFFFQNGLEVNVTGATNQLRSLKIDGGPDNKLMSQFRQDIEDKNADEIAQLCVQFVQQNPTSQVGAYLLRQYLLETEKPYYQKAQEVAQTLYKAQPNNTRIEQMLHQIEELCSVQVGQKAPDFEVKDVQGIQHKLSDYKGQTLLLTFGAAAYEGYRDMLRTLRDDVKDMEEDRKPAMIHLLLDASKPLSRSLLYDSIPGANVQELRSFHAPIAKKYHIASYPTFILINKDQHIQMRESDWQTIKSKL